MWKVPLSFKASFPIYLQGAPLGLSPKAPGKIGGVPGALSPGALKGREAPLFFQNQNG